MPEMQKFFNQAMGKLGVVSILVEHFLKRKSPQFGQVVMDFRVFFPDQDQGLHEFLIQSFRVELLEFVQDVVFYLGLGLFDDRGGMPQSVIKIKKKWPGFLSKPVCFSWGRNEKGRVSLDCGPYSIGFTQIEIPIEHPTLHFSKKMSEKLQETLFETIPFHSIHV